VTTYERVVDGEVVERVTPIDGSHEDTRIGVLVLEGSSEWRLAAGEPPTAAEEQQTDPPAPPAPAADDIPKDLSGADSASDASAAGTSMSEEPDGAATTDGNGAGAGGDKPRGGRQRG
jgi:hypothetical protein